MGRQRFISSTIEIREGDHIVPSKNPDAMLCISGVGFFFTIFFENQKALDLIKDGLDKVKISKEE